METAKYRIGGHLVTLDSFDAALLNLLPNLNPFRIDDSQADGRPALAVHVVSHVDVPADMEPVRRFEYEGTIQDVQGTPRGEYLIDLGLEHSPSLAARILCRTLEDGSAESYVQMLSDAEYDMRYGLNNCMMISYAYAGSRKGTLLVHASVIRKDGKGYLMTAPSGTGKSTHTRLWYNNIPGCDLMNDDNPVVRLGADGSVTVYGSPWSGKTPCYRNIEAPVGALVRITRGPENSIRRLGPVQAMAVLLPAMSSMRWDSAVHRGVGDTISGIIENVAVWELTCLPDAQAAHLCYETVSGQRTHCNG